VRSQGSLHTYRRRGAFIVAALTSILVMAGVAAAGSGGGIDAPGTPEVRDVTCKERCAGMRAAAEGSKVELRGRNLDYTNRVLFAADGSGRVEARPEAVSAEAVEVKVPAGAATGKPKLVTGSGQEAEAPVALEIVPDDQIGSSNDFRVRDLAAKPPKGYFAGRKRAAASFLLDSASAQDVRVDVIADDGTVVSSILKEDQPPGAPTKIGWNGKTDAGEVAPNGSYEFEVKSLSGGEGGAVAFEQYDHQFPVRGPHVYGDGLGAGRGHRGQDLAADCETRLVAARGGKVKAKGYQADGAGNYVVIDGKGTDVDYAYMHMIDPAIVDEGEKVKTGEKIGAVGSTGRSTGCHLHFEMWNGPWYEGGKVMDPTPHLKKWDDWS
jgi:murein DD-endopeptidase MepM/ murein hydrolase activator NlpD